MIQPPKELVEHQHLPMQSGLRVPYITHRDPRTGRYRFGVNDVGLSIKCVVGRLCGVCGKPLEELKILIVADENFPTQASPEPALHPWCARYTARACPMLNGTMNRHTALPADDIAGYGKLVTPGRGERDVTHGTPAAAWYQLWIRGDYGVGIDHITMLPSWVVWKELPVLRVRQLREPALIGETV